MLFFTAIADVSNRLHIMVKMFFFVISIAKKDYRAPQPYLRLQLVLRLKVTIKF